MINIFNTHAIRVRVAVMYLVAQLCLHVVNNFLRLPGPDENMPYLSPYHQPVVNKAKLCENVQIPRKRATFVARLKIPHSAENCGPYT